MQVRKAVFPAAGFGTRFLPVTKAQPKEMLPIVDKPVIQYLVEEAAASGIREIIMVTGRGKRAIEDHFDYSYELEGSLVEKGKHALMQEVRAIAELAKFAYVRQHKPLGDGHAILCAEECIGSEPFAVMFGDELIDAKVPALKQLIKVFAKKRAPIIGLQEVERSEISSYGIIKGKHLGNGLYKIEDLVEKPSPQKAPSNFAVIGKYVLTPEVLKSLRSAPPSKDGEIRLIEGLKKYLKKRPLYGQVIVGKRYDTGEKFGFLKATIDFALKRHDLGPRLKRHLRTLDLT